MSATELHGSLAIKVDNLNMTVFGEFTKTDGGEKITAKHIIRQLKKQHISHGYSAKDIELRLQELATDTPESAEIILAEGNPPIPAEQETAEFTEQSIPAEVKEHCDLILQSAHAPILYKERIEEIPDPDGGKKKGTKSVKRRDRVQLDQTMRGHGYVYAEEEIGHINAGKAGKDGTDVFGKHVPADLYSDPLFHVGKGLIRKGSRIVAKKEGLLRWGQNWAEILSFVPHCWSLALSPDKATCLLNFQPGEKETPLPDENDILGRLEELDYPTENLIPTQDILYLMKRAVNTDRTIKNYPISTSRDAEYYLDISEDKMTARLNVHKGRGRGKPLRLKEIGGMITAEKLQGLDQQKIKNDLLAFYVDAAADLNDYLLCDGVAPEEGPEREISYDVSFMSEKEFESAVQQLKNEPEGIQSLSSNEDFPLEGIQQMAKVAAQEVIATLSPAELGSQGKDVYGKILPGLPGKTAQILLHENIVERENLILAAEDGVLDKGEIEGITHLRVRSHKDAEVIVEVSPDGMQAVLTLFSSLGSGKPLDNEMVYKAINEAGIVQGIDNNKVEELIQHAINGESVQGEIFAIGKQAVPAGDVQIEYQVDLASGKGVRLRQDGTADFRNQDNITRVSEGDFIAILLPPTISAEDGFEVTGKILPAPKENPNIMDIDDSIRQEARPDGTVRLYATMEGELTNQNNTLAVRSTHTVKGDVNMGTGNIKFPGTVQVTESVRSGFYIIAEGDILIGGAVEGALVSADGDVKIAQGVKGSKKAVIRSKKSILSMFAEQASLLAVEDIKIKNSIMHCRTKTNGAIILGHDKSTILGGHAFARDGIISTNIGSPRGIHTTVSFGQDYLIGDKIEQEEKEIEKIKKIISQLDQSMRQPENRNNEKALEILRKKKVNALKSMEKRGMRLFSLRERFEEHYDSSITVRGTVYPGVTIESHGRTLEIQEEKKNISFQFDQQSGRILVAPNEKKE